MLVVVMVLWNSEKAVMLATSLTPGRHLQGEQAKFGA